MLTLQCLDMKSSRELLKSISQLVHKLIASNEKLESDKKDLLRERERFIVERAENIKIIEKYQRESKTKDIYTSFVIGEGDKLRAKRQVEKILREINDCITTINSKQ